MIATPEVRTRMTAEQYYAQTVETTRPMQLLDGRLIVPLTPTPLHQLTLAGFMIRLRTDRTDGTLLMSPIDLELDEHNVPQPDLVWVKEGGRCIIGPKRLQGPPELIVEVLSPGTAGYDKVGKFRLYERHGVSEYWIADPSAGYVEVFRWIEGRYHFQGIYGRDESFVSAILGDQVVNLSGVFLDAPA
jgi:Uma2 family endonuclease